MKLEEIAKLAKEALPESSFDESVNVSCTSCGRFLFEAYSATFQKTRCASCKSSVAVLITKTGEVTAAILSPSSTSAA